jgi:Plavaka transposase
MHAILAPIASCGEMGVAMASGDGIWRQCHPIFAIFVGDYPEKTLVMCTFKDRCPKCTIPADQLGEHCSYPPRNLEKALDTYELADEDMHKFLNACKDADIKPIYKPFWEPLLLANVYISITPDILHQLLQGVMKHLIKWISSNCAFGPAVINARCQILPPNHNIRLFPKGITFLSQVTGKEHKAICSILLGLVINLALPGSQAPSHLLGAVRVLLDFLFLAQLPSHMTETLERLEESLGHFHDNKEVFVDLGVREQFNLPKLHSLQHNQSSIMLFGTTDNYNTEQSECLHIDLVKDTYHAMNHRDEYPQMTTWLEHWERIAQHTVLIQQQEQVMTNEGHTAHQRGPLGPLCASTYVVRMAKNPTFKAVPFEVIESHTGYNATYFQNALAEYITWVNNPTFSGRRLHSCAANTLILFNSVPVFSKIKFSLNGNAETVDSVHVQPEQVDVYGCTIPA